MEPGKRYEMLWDCGFCGTEGNLGLTHRCCPACGAPQDPTRRYYPPPDRAVAVEDHPFVGADVTCPACGAPSAAGPSHCGRCGAALDGATAVARRDAQAGGADGFAADDASAARAEHAARRADREREVAARSLAAAAPRRGTGWIVGLVMAVISTCGCGGLLTALLWTRPVEVEVVGHAWERAVDVETLRTVSDTAWRDGLPGGARSVSCQRAERSTRQVPDGETCVNERVDLGDGTFSVEERCTARYRSEPVYDDRCTFEIDRWVVTDTRAVAGRDRAPRAPDESLARPGTCLGCERLGARRDRHDVELRDPDGEVHRCTVDAAWWARIDVGDRLVAAEGALTGLFSCADLAEP